MFEGCLVAIVTPFRNGEVDYDKLDPEARRRCTRRRCYKWVSLLHWREGAYVYAAAALVPGNAHECPILYELVYPPLRS